MHEECKDNSFHLCNRSINDETNTKVASDLADADNYSHNEKEISTADLKCQTRKLFFWSAGTLHARVGIGSVSRQI